MLVGLICLVMVMGLATGCHKKHPPINPAATGDQAKGPEKTSGEGR